jgi:hypothetical protein
MEVDMRGLWPARLGVLVALAGCGPGGAYSYDGYVMEGYFPFDGERSWEFISTDTTVGRKIVSTLDSTPEDGASHTIYTITSTRECLDVDPDCKGTELLRDVRWSADQTDGVLIHSWDEGGTNTTFDPPLQLALPRMAVGEVAETQTNGVTYTSTFQAITDCPVQWTDAWTECVQLVVDDGGAGTAPAGTWFAVSGYNVVAFQLTGDTGQWELLFATYVEGE